MRKKNTIKLRSGKNIVCITAFKSIDELYEIASKTMDMLENETYIPEEKKSRRDIKELDKVSKKGIQREERSLVRDRLPNVVNLNDYTLEQPKKKEAMIRCPKCRQSFAAIVEDSATHEFKLLVKKNGTNKFEVTKGSYFADTKDNIIKQAGVSVVDFYQDIQKAEVDEDTDINVDYEAGIDIQCPLCWEYHPVGKWLDAYNNPLEYSEYEAICDICGGELVAYIDKDAKDKHMSKCENCFAVTDGNNLWTWEDYKNE